MSMHTLNPALVERFARALRAEEKSRATIEKYLRDLRAFHAFLGEAPEVDKAAALRYKEHLTARYAPASVNSMLAAVNRFFQWAGWPECRVKALRLQRRTFEEEGRELTRADYVRLLDTAQRTGKRQLRLLMETICSTGIRVSELRFITVEAAETGRAEVACKGRRRTVLLPPRLTGKLREFARRQGIGSGSIFRSGRGEPVSRFRVWAQMKALCAEAGVDKNKVFPHNLRHLFARTFYGAQKDIVRLADVLGHSDVNTTRLYTRESGAVHARQIAMLGLVV